MSPNQYVSDLRAERDALRAKVARVEALADGLREPSEPRLGGDWEQGFDDGRESAAYALASALGYTESDPAVTTRQGTTEGAGDGV